MRRLHSAQLLLTLYLVVSTAYVGYRGVGLIDKYFAEPADFGVFYAAGRQVVTHERDLLYERENTGLGEKRRSLTAGNFFNPPLLAYLFSPLTLVPLLRAKALLLAWGLLATGALVLVSQRWAREKSDLAFTALAAASFWPLYTAFHLGQPSPIFALVAALSIVALESSRWQVAGWLASTLVLKPSIAPLHLAVIAVHGRRVTVIVLVVGALLFGLAPFLLLGEKAFRDYLDLLSQSRLDAFQLIGRVSSGAVLMFNWNGFFGRLVARNPNPYLVIALDILTLALMMKVWLKRDLLDSWLACALATNLAVPHMLYYDLLLLLAPSFAIAMRKRDPVIVAALAVTHLAINVSMFEIYWGGFSVGKRDDLMVIFAAPAMFLLLSLLAFDGLRAWAQRWLATGEDASTIHALGVHPPAGV